MKRLDRIEEFKVLEGIEPDHMPLYNRLRCKTKKQKGKELKEVKEILKWNEKYIRKYKEISSKKLYKEVILEGNKMMDRNKRCG